jgi:hypothetical protein
MEKLTVLVGAGGSLELDVASTPAVTEALLSRDPSEATEKFLREQKQTLRAVFKTLEGHYKTPNFEHLLHALECIISLKRSWRSSTAEKFRVLYAHLCAGPRGEFVPIFQDSAAEFAVDRLYRDLHDLFARHHVQAQQHKDWALYESVWSKLNAAFSLDVATTNYDSLIEQALPGIVQGFAPISGEQTHRFDPRVLGAATQKLMHLHGSIHFGYRETSAPVNRFAYEDEWEDLYWHADPAKAVASWGSRSHHTSQAGEESIVGPLITGMQKPNKVLASEPYLTYYRTFGQVIQDNARLLIIGYGFGDNHINQIMSRMTRWHGPKRRIAFVTWCPEKEWLHRHHGYDHLEEITSVERWSEENNSWTDGMNYSDIWTSKNGLVRIYTMGLLATAGAHLDDLVQFLK